MERVHGESHGTVEAKKLAANALSPSMPHRVPRRETPVQMPLAVLLNSFARETLPNNRRSETQKLQRKKGRRTKRPR